MTSKALKTFLALWLALAGLPGMAWSCDKPCGMSQKQMRACAEACALGAQQGPVIGHAACVSFHVQAAPSMQSVDEVSAASPVFNSAFISPASVQSASPEFRMALPGRAPPGAAQQALLSLPRSHAPPALI